MSRPHSHWLNALWVSASAGLIYLVLLQSLPLFQSPMLRVQDLLLKARNLTGPKQPGPDQIFLIVLDDESIEKIGEKWPFRRKLYAKLIRQINLAQPRLIALDLIFSGKDQPVDDILLSQAIEQSGKVILASHIDSSGNYVLPFPMFGDVAKGLGVVNKLTDRDRYVRTANLYYRAKTGSVGAWSWELEILFSIMSIDPHRYRFSGNQLLFDSAQKGSEIAIPSFRRDEIKINYRYRLEDINHLPLWKVLETEDLQSWAKEKIVVVGSTSKVLHDDYQTPIGVMPGVMVNINTLLTMMNQDYLKSIPLWIGWGWLFLFVFVATWIGFRLNLAFSLLMMGVWTVLPVCVFWLAATKNYVGDLFSSLFVAWLVYLIVIFYRSVKTFLENAQLQRKASTDPLTGLFNRRILEEKINQEIKKVTAAQGVRKMQVSGDLSVMMIDIDHFKKVNDTYGHPFGDQVLKNVSLSLLENMRRDDVVARFGGEEFCVVLPHTNTEEALQVGEKIRRQVESAEYDLEGQQVRITISVGVASAKTDNLLDFNALISAADKALYEAKIAGRNMVRHYTHNK